LASTANYIGKFIRSRGKRSSEENFANENFKFTKTRLDDDLDDDELPFLPDEHKHAFHGGERALLYAVVEDFIATFGVDGKACVLRTICEVHSKAIHHYGLVGEMVKLFLT
jgi:DM4/DM12 family